MHFFIYIFLGTMLIGVPIAFCMAFAPLVTFTIMGKTVYYKMLVQRLYAGIDSFPIMAIPFFMLAGQLMNTGGITVNLVRLANALVGHLRGGLAHVNIVASILFAGLSGSAVADTSALGSILIPAMEKDGYSKEFSAAVTAASSIIGPIIPPSIIMIIYAYVMGVSVGGLFAAGIVPGLLVGFLLMVVAWIISRKRGYPKRGKASLREILRATKDSFLPLLTAVIIIGGILGGIFTPTEAAAVAVGYALFLTLFVMRSLRLKELPGIFLNAALSSSLILLIIGTATIFGWMVSTSQLPAKLSAFMAGITKDPYLMFFLVNVFLLIVGMFMDASPAILIFGPLFGPAMVKMGIDPLHFAIVMCVNLTVGLATPPVGLVLFVASGLTGLSVERIAKEMAPFLAVEILIIFIISYLPAIPMTVPKLLGFA